MNSDCERALEGEIHYFNDVLLHSLIAWITVDSLCTFLLEKAKGKTASTVIKTGFVNFSCCSNTRLIRIILNGAFLKITRINCREMRINLVQFVYSFTMAIGKTIDLYKG